MKKLVAIFFFFLLFLLAFGLVTDQFHRHSLVSSASEPKTSDQLAQEAWEYKRKEVNAHGEKWEASYPLQLSKIDFFLLRKIGINGINQENDNLLATVKETTPLKTYAELSERVKRELKNLVQIENWALKLANLFQKNKLIWRKKFWDRLRKKYFSYLKKYEIDTINLVDGDYQFFDFYSSIPGIANLPFEKLSSMEKWIVPTIYLNTWESGVRKAINSVALNRNDEIPFVDGETFWKNSFRSTHLVDLKKYQIRVIEGIEIASLLTLTKGSEFINFTFQQQEQFHNLVNLINYQIFLTTAIKPKKQADAFWTNFANRAKINQLLNYDLLPIDNVSLDQFTSDDIAKAFTDLINQQWEQLNQLLNLKDYEKKITALLQQEKAIENFWTINKNKINQLLRYQLLTIDDLTINQFHLSDINKIYLALNKNQKNQLRELFNLENYQKKSTALLNQAKESEKFWNESKDKIKELLKYQLLTVSDVTINQFRLSDINKTYLVLNKSQKNQLRKLINLENYASKITLLLREEQQVENFWSSSIIQKQLTTFFQASITTLSEVKINHLNKDLLTSDYLVLTPLQKTEVKKLSQLTNFSQAVLQAVAKAKEKEKTNQLSPILALSINFFSLLLLAIFGYLYWKNQKKKKQKKSHK